MTDVIGRQGELAGLEDFADRVMTGEAAVLLLSGAAGIGKSTLWTEGLAAARRRSLRVLSCRPTEAETHLPYAGLGDLLAEVGEEVLALLPGPQRQALEVALLRASPTGPALEQRAVATGVLGVLTALARSGPSLVAVDDVQWLDSPSARALAFALRRLGEIPLGILASVREEQGHDVALGLASLPHLQRLEVGPLSSENLERLLRTRLRMVFPRPVILQLHRVSRGNPFFALELGAALLRRRAPLRPGEALPVPETLRGLMAERLGRLSLAGRDVVLAVSALSRPTEALLLADATDATRGRAGLEEAMEARILEVDAGQVRFTHPLLGACAYSEASPVRRRGLHRRLARVVVDPEERARHLALGATGPDEAVASALDEAARRARARGAPESAAALLEQAAQLTALAGDIRRRTLEAADCHFMAGELTLAQELLEALLVDSSPGPERGRVLERLGALRAQQMGFRRAEDTFRAALAEAGEDAWLRASVECDLAFCILAAGDGSGGADHARAALPLAEQLGDPCLLLHATIFVLFFEFLLGQGTDPELFERAVELEDAVLAGQVEIRPGLLQVPHVPANILKWTDRLEAARYRYLSSYQRAMETGDESGLPFLCCHLSELESWAGDWNLAARYAEEAARAAEEVGQDELRASASYPRALVKALRGEAAAARAIAEEGLTLCERTGNLPFIALLVPVLGFLALSEGDAAEAHRRLGPMTQFLAVMGVSEPAVVRYVPDEVEALVALGQLDQAQGLLDSFEERARALDRIWALATSARCRGLLLAASGDLVGALATLERGLEEHMRLAQPFELGRTLLVQGAIRRRAKQKRAARESLQRALEIFETLGARLWAEKARAEFARISGRAPATHELTATEQRIAELVAAGYTNREVADTLFLSPKTVENQLSRIFGKLGVASRRELARRLESTAGSGL